MPRPGATRVEMYPLTENELEEVHRPAAARDQRPADVVLVAGWTGAALAGAAGSARAGLRRGADAGPRRPGERVVLSVAAAVQLYAPS